MVTWASRSASRWRLSSRVALDTSTSSAHGSFSPLQIGKQVLGILTVTVPRQLAASGDAAAIKGTTIHCTSTCMLSASNGDHSAAWHGQRQRSCWQPLPYHQHPFGQQPPSDLQLLSGNVLAWELQSLATESVHTCTL
jgi:hypothetical protein